jgi:pimeloyl-ACP methyl ester carboxylesterase
VIIGELDLPDFHNIADTLYRGIASAHRIEISDVGHFSSLEDPARFAEAVLPFLQENP